MARKDYVEITREEVEDWLRSLPYKWSRKEQRAGIYYVHFSAHVGCSVSTSIGSKDRGMGLGRAAMHLTLISLTTGKTLNRKAKDRKSFQRTKNWRKTWADGIKHWLGVYQQMAGFYDKIAPIEDRAKYQDEMMARIEAIPDWENDRMLASLHTQVAKGSILSDAQTKSIGTTKSNPPAQAKPAPVGDDDYWIGIARELYRAVRSSGNDFALGLTKSIGMRFKARREPSEKQWRAFLNLLDKNRIRYDEKKVPTSITKRMAAESLTARYFQRGITRQAACDRITGGQRLPYQAAVWEMFKKTYQKIGLFLSSPDQLLNYPVWELCLDGGTPIAFSLYKKTQFGLKSGLGGSAGTSAGKSAYVRILREKFNQKGYYGEVSHKVEAIVIASGSPVVCTQYVPPILRKPIQADDDGIHYTRSLKGVGVVRKVLVGQPLGTPTTKAQQPHCPLPVQDTPHFSAEGDIDNPFELLEHFSGMLA